MSSESNLSQYCKSEKSQKSSDLSSLSESDSIYNDNKKFFENKKKSQVDYFQNINICNSEFSAKQPNSSLICITNSAKSLKLYKKPLLGYKTKKSGFYNTNKKKKNIKSQKSYNCFFAVGKKNKEQEKKFKEDLKLDHDFIISKFDVKSYISPPKIVKEINKCNYFIHFNEHHKNKKNEDKLIMADITPFQF